MDLIKLRIIGHPLLDDSPWLEVGSGLNMLRATHPGRAAALLGMLQTINPPYRCDEVDPYQGLPSFITGHPHRRRIIAAKKTAAIAIFSASARMIETLAGVDPLLYETNWIEVGRRRDYSRWMNFVELSGAARWSEIGPLIEPFLAIMDGEEGEAAGDLRAALRNWRPGDRIKGETADRLTAQIRTLQSLLPESQRTGIEDCLHLVDRARRFRLAKDMVFARLPLFLSLLDEAQWRQALEPETHGPLYAGLIARLKAQAPVPADLNQTILRANALLAAEQWAASMRMQAERETVRLHRVGNGRPLSSAEPGSIQTVEMVLAGMIALHRAILGDPPILLIDTTAIDLSRSDRVALLRVLRNCAATAQCFLITDEELLGLCTDSWGEASPDGGRLRVVDC